MEAFLRVFFEGEHMLVKQKIMVRSADRTRFVDAITELAAMGAKRLPGSVPRLIAPFMVDMEITLEREKALKSTPVMIAYPVAFEKYTVQELETMVWDEFRAAVGQAGVKGRDRQKMIEDYILVLKNSGQ